MGMPFQNGDRPDGPVAAFVGFVFDFIEILVRVVILPVAAVSAFLSRGLVAILGVPGRVMGFAGRLIGVLVIIALLVLLFTILASLTSLI